MLKPARIDGHGLCIAEAEHKHHDRTDRVKMSKRIECQSAVVARGRIAAEIGRIAV